MTSLGALDVALFHWINGVAHAPFWDAFFLWITRPPYRVALFGGLLIALLIWGGPRGRRAAIIALLVVVAADQLSSTLLKPWIGRVRPCFALDSVRLLWPRQAHSPSFPSGHATNTMAVAVVLFSVRPWVGWVALVVAVLVGYSRIYIGVHYPSDVLGGALLGALVGAAGLSLAARIEGAVRKNRPGSELRA